MNSYQLQVLKIAQPEPLRSISLSSHLRFDVPSPPPMRRTIALLFLLAVALPASARDSTDHWIELRSQHFVVLTNTNEKQARRVASQFEQMRAVFHVLMPTGSDSPGSPIVVLALKDKKAFQTLEPESYLAKGQLDLAGYFIPAPDKNYIILRLDAPGDRPFATVYHEYTHYMLRGASEWIPLWLNEGLAEFYQNTDIQEKDVLLGQASSDDVLYLRQNHLLPLATLLTVDQSSPYYHEEQKGSVFYAESWALTHYIEITDAQKGTHHLQDYANLLRKKESSVVAAQQAFGDLDQLQKLLERYISQGRFMLFKMNKVVTVDESSFHVREMSSPDADAIRADVLVYNDRTKDAQALIDATLRDDPKNALAHETMGYIKFREGDIQAARKWYGEAVNLDSQSYLAHYYFATMSMKSSATEADAEIESNLRICMKLNPGFAPAYDALAIYDSRDPAKAEEAHLLNLHAITLEPGNVDYRLNAAAVLMNEQKYDDAIAVLNTASHIATGPEQLVFIQTRIRQIKDYQAAMATRHQEENEAATPTATAFVSGVSLKSASALQTPKYPTESPSGPHHSVKGVLRSVRCSYPSIITLTVDQPGKAPEVSLYRNDFNQIAFSATNFTPEGDLNPCTDLEGREARVAYAEVSDKSIAGQILSVELSK